MCIGGSALYNLVMTLLIIVSILIVIATMMQPQKQQDALNALSGGAVFSGQTKKRGFEAFMEKVTSVLLVLFCTSRSKYDGEAFFIKFKDRRITAWHKTKKFWPAF